MIAFTAISFVHSRDLHWFYVAKSIFVFGAMHAVLIWYLVKAKGVSMTTLANEEPVRGSAHAWLVMRAFNSGLGAASSLSVNQGDMTRYARKPKDAIWVGLFPSYVFSHAMACFHILVFLADSVDHTVWLSHRLSLALPVRHFGGRLCEKDWRHRLLEHVGRPRIHARAVPGQ